MWYGEYEKCVLSYRKEKKKKTGNPRHMWEVNIITNLKIFWTCTGPIWPSERSTVGRGRGFCRHGAVSSDFLTR
jgi:hypothetical protein